MSEWLATPPVIPTLTTFDARCEECGALFVVILTPEWEEDEKDCYFCGAPNERPNRVSEMRHHPRTERR